MRPIIDTLFKLFLTGPIALGAISSAGDWVKNISLGVKAHAEGKLDDAEHHFHEALAIASRTENAGHLARTWNNLGAVAHARGRYQEAEQHYLKAAEYWERQQEKHGLEYVRLKNNLAVVYRALGKPAEAEPLARETVRLAGTEAAPHTGVYLRNLAEILRSQGRTDEALNTAKRALEALEALAERPLLRIAEVRQSMAAIESERGNVSEAERLEGLALAIYEEHLGAEHPRTASTVSNLGHYLMAQSRWTEARPLLDRALRIWEETLGPRHPCVAVGLNNLAQWHRAQGETRLAEPLYRRALATWEESLGRKHPDYAKGLINLGELFAMQQKHRGAEQLFKQALEISRNALGEDHPQTQRVLRRLVSLYAAQGRASDLKKVSTTLLPPR